jgi:hypothetical protein
MPGVRMEGKNREGSSLLRFRQGWLALMVFLNRPRQALNLCSRRFTQWPLLLMETMPLNPLNFGQRKP